MFNFGAQTRNFDLTGKKSRQPDHHRSDVNVASMDGYRPYPGPFAQPQIQQNFNQTGYEEQYPRERMQPEQEPKHEGPKYFLHKFAERTSLQGIPYIYAVRKTYRKCLWALLFVVMTLATIAHLSLLTHTYLQFETSSKIKLVRDNLDFPSVTVCNLNPIVLSMLPNTSPEMLSIQQQLDPYKRRKKRQAQNGQNADAGYLGNISGVPLLDEDNLDFDDDGEFSDDELFGGGEISTATRIFETFYYYMGLLSRQERQDAGHNDRLILDCIFNGRVCETKQFQPYLSREYGNCYTFNSKNQANKIKSFKSIRSGYNLGLQLVLFTQDSEYLQGLTTAKGIKVTVHQFGTMPNLDTGLSLTPGFETFLGLKMKVITRKNQPYGDCGDNGFLEKRFENKYKYSLDACLNVCKHKLIYDKCGCYEGDYIEYYSEKEVLNAPTGLCDTDVEFACTDGVTDTNNPCGCHQGCNETQYTTDLSTNYWPSTNKWDDLIEIVCDNYGSTSDTCQSLENETDTEFALRKNFLKLNVYYEDLTAEVIDEEPSYSVVQFASDIGGVFGLWIGASILSLCEVIDLVLSICCACCRDKRNINSRRRRTQNTSQFDGQGHMTQFDGQGYRGNPMMGYGGKQGPTDAEWGAPPPFWNGQ